ncbi:MAG: 50S ribosomal protein L1 [Proteobacteria bacterium]|jgi:large subunit ribosomal protein L1|uniref:Large ribosomal subunit protein uL1 n=1 Tax=SAR86 cluster bacterium TaxID=2030880 RepID=A0A937LGQ1_9GAMM|nr:50S ribosomal protein L1 [SAR86 cluster bacterium]MDA0775296.1 50S ribosomal protein L1 [Pseudomonadota bacterium]MDA0976062.1 50S ribosomal protein L1 [Pseudomonadota bacterium]MDA1037239.1 50S ribosomal protein L1 [Pseudomonadota bacterium]
MSKITKKQKLISEKLDTEKVYSIAEAIEIMQSVKSEKFEESIDIAVRLGIDPTKSDQNVRGAVTLPNSLGKEVSVAVFADGDQADAAKKAGADHIGMDDLAEKFSKEEIVVDVVIATNAAMKVVGKLGQVLGPKGLMPNPKTGTVTDDVATAISNTKAGQVRFRTDKNGIIHGSIGKVSFDEEKIKANASALLEELKKLKPASAKGVYIGNIALSSTMGPGIKISASELV